ncbi:MAG: hypothetical protein WBD62_00200 [Anaerolineales bacterium]
MNRKIIIIVAFGMLILSTACAQQEIENLINDANNVKIEQPAGEEIQLQQEGIGPIEITPLSPGDEGSFAPSTDGDGGNISSKGERTTNEASGGEPGMIESKSPSGLTLEEEISQVVNWLSYQDQTYRFSIDYPESYMILPEEGLSLGSEPGLLMNVRFLDQQLASGDTADLEIPDFTIEIFDLGNQTLETFLEDNLERGERERYKLGDLSGFRVYLNQMIAPNEFYYFAEYGFVYKLTPLGMYSQEMLDSFQVR